MYSKICQICGQGYISEHRVSRGCCEEHELQARKLPKVKVKCAHCGKKIMRSVAAATRTCFCSTKCKWAASGREAPTRDCIQCGKTFIVEDRGSKKKYCSPKCAGVAMREQREKSRDLLEQIHAPNPTSHLEPSTIETWDVCVGY